MVGQEKAGPTAKKREKEKGSRRTARVMDSALSGATAKGAIRLERNM